MSFLCKEQDAAWNGTEFSHVEGPQFHFFGIWNKQWCKCLCNTHDVQHFVCIVLDCLQPVDHCHPIFSPWLMLWLLDGNVPVPHFHRKFHCMLKQIAVVRSLCESWIWSSWYGLSWNEHAQFYNPFTGEPKISWVYAWALHSSMSSTSK